MLINFFSLFLLIGILLKLVSDRINGFQVFLSPLAELGAKPCDMRVNRSYIAEIVKAPHIVKQLLTAVNPADRLRKLFKYFEFLDGELYLFAVEAYLKRIDEFLRSRASTLFTSTTGENGFVT